MVQTATAMWGYKPFIDFRPASRNLHRHVVLHGRSTGYGTAEDSAGVLFTLTCSKMSQMPIRKAG